MNFTKREIFCFVFANAQELKINVVAVLHGTSTCQVVKFMLLSGVGVLGYELGEKGSVHFLLK
jgi:hypothetical protein